MLGAGKVAHQVKAHVTKPNKLQFDLLDQRSRRATCKLSSHFYKNAVAGTSLLLK